MFGLLKDLREFRHALASLLIVSIKTTVASTRLGWVWWILDPLLMMAIYYFIINIVFQRGGEGYHLFVLSGIVAWQLFARSINSAVGCVVKNRGIIRQTRTPVELLVAVPCTVQLFFALVGVMIVCLWSNEFLGLISFSVLPLLLLIFLLAYAISLFLAITQVFFADTGKLVGYVVRAGFFLTPVLYPSSRVLEAEGVPDLAKTLFALNPVGWSIEQLRGVVLHGAEPDWQQFAWIAAFALLFVQAGLSYLRLYSNRIVKML